MGKEAKGEVQEEEKRITSRRSKSINDGNVTQYCLLSIMDERIF